MMSKLWMSIRRHSLQLTADRKRFGIFCALLAIGMLFWTRLIVIQDMPRVAMAETGLLESITSEKNPSVEAIPIRRVIPVAEGPIRNPFQINPSYYPPVINNEKSIDEESKSRLLPVDIVRSALSTHRLEAVMGSVAVVSGQTCRVGMAVQDLTGGGHWIELAEVRDRSVLIRCGDVQHVLHLD